MTQPNDPSKKSPRTFQCRDQLWETFEQMARELECSIDYLVNEAMKQYARQRSYGGAGVAATPSQRTPFPGARDTSNDVRANPLPPTGDLTVPTLNRLKQIQLWRLVATSIFPLNAALVQGMMKKMA